MRPFLIMNLVSRFKTFFCYCFMHFCAFLNTGFLPLNIFFIKPLFDILKKCCILPTLPQLNLLSRHVPFTVEMLCVMKENNLLPEIYTKTNHQICFICHKYLFPYPNFAKKSTTHHVVFLNALLI